MWEVVKNANGRERERKLLANLVIVLTICFKIERTMLKFMTFTLCGGLST